MSTAEIIRIALRYTLALGRGHLSVFMSMLSIIGLVLGVAVLLVVLSVMNGFDREMRDRILGLVPHMTVHTGPDRQPAQAQGERLAALPWVVDVRPFVSFEAVASRGSRVAIVSGLGLEAFPAPLRSVLKSRQLADVDGAVVGDSVADRLGLKQGDFVNLIVPDGASARSERLRSQRLRVAFIVDTGTELDESLLLLPLAQASEVANLGGGVSGLYLQLDDPFSVDRRMPALRGMLDPGNYVTNWRLTHGNLYAAIQLSRDLVVLLLASIIGVAAFNVVSALVLVVIDKRGAIAILRTLGAKPGDMARVFLAQGVLIGLIGALLGSALGVAISLALPGAVQALEQGLGFSFLSTDVYPVSFIPVDLRPRDALVISVTAVLMCVAAAVYPALRAARLQPAQVLHQVR